MAGDDPRSLEARPGKTPVLDGVISPGEWDDATVFSGVEGWKPQFSAVTGTKDLSLKGYVKHDGKRLYFAFDVTDDVLYGIDTPRWLPSNNPKAHELTREGFPWFGDEMEVLINASNHWTGNQDSAGNGSSWQMVCNLTKSRKGGVGAGGLLEGEPRRNEDAWRHVSGVDSLRRAGMRRQAETRRQGLHHRMGGEFQPMPGSRTGSLLLHRDGRPPDGPEYSGRRFGRTGEGAPTTRTASTTKTHSPARAIHARSYTISEPCGCGPNSIQHFRLVLHREPHAARQAAHRVRTIVNRRDVRRAIGIRDPHSRAAAPRASFRPSRRRAPPSRPRPRRCIPSPRSRRRRTGAAPTTYDSWQAHPPAVPRGCSVPRSPRNAGSLDPGIGAILPSPIHS